MYINEVRSVSFIYLFLFVYETCTNQTKTCATEIIARAIQEGEVPIQVIALEKKEKKRRF